MGTEVAGDIMAQVRQLLVRNRARVSKGRRQSKKLGIKVTPGTTSV